MLEDVLVDDAVCGGVRLKGLVDHAQDFVEVDAVPAILVQVFEDILDHATREPEKVLAYLVEESAISSLAVQVDRNHVCQQEIGIVLIFQ